MLIGFGKLANDLPFNGIKALYWLDTNSDVGLTIDRLSFDFERPQSVLGIVRDRHLADWQVTDAASRRPARVSDCTTTGLSPGSTTGPEACSAPLQAVR